MGCRALSACIGSPASASAPASASGACAPVGHAARVSQHRGPHLHGTVGARMGAFLSTDSEASVTTTPFCSGYNSRLVQSITCFIAAMAASLVGALTRTTAFFMIFKPSKWPTSTFHLLRSFAWRGMMILTDRARLPPQAAQTIHYGCCTPSLVQVAISHRSRHSLVRWTHRSTDQCPTSNDV